MSVSSFLEKLKQRVSPTPVDETGMWYQNDDVIVPSNKITMKGPNGEDDYFEKPILGVGMQSGKKVMMQPGEEYEFPEDKEVYETQMQLGGRIDNVSSRGDVDFSVASKNKLSGQVVGSINAPSLQMNSLTPRLAYSNKGFNANVSPGGFGAGYEGEKGYIDYNQSTAGKDTYRTASAGYNTERVNLNANATMRNNMLENAGIEGSYQVTPNLSLSGNYNINKGEQGTDKNYFAGFRYTKSFEEGGEVEDDDENDDDKEMVEGIADILRRVKDKENRKQIADKMVSDFEEEDVKYNLKDFRKAARVMQMGGMSIPGVNGTVVASDNSPRLKKAYMQQAGYVKYVPPSKRPLTFQSSNPSTMDNTRVANPVNPSKPITKPVVKPPTKTVSPVESSEFTKVALQKMRDLEKVYSAEMYQEKLDKLRAKEKANPNVDYSLVVDKPYMDLNDPEQVKTLYEAPSIASKALDILPTNLSFFARGALGMDNTTGNLSDKHIQELGYAVNNSMKRKQTSAYGFDGSFGYDDYRNGRTDYNDAANNNKVLTTTEVADLQTSIGQAKYKVLPNGDVVVADNYNFDEYAKSPENIYQAGEVLGAKMGINTQTYVVVPKDYIKDAPVETSAKPQKTSLREKYVETKSVTPKQPLPKTTPISKSSVQPKAKSTTGTNAVANYQKMLNEQYGAGLSVDGAWGSKTQAAYEKYILKK
jgi:hypothetical protein